MIEENGKHKPMIETMINTSALAFTSYGIILSTTETGTIMFLRGILLVCIGAGLEFFKYWGRKKKLW